VPTRSQIVLAAVCDELLGASADDAAPHRCTPLYIVASPRPQTGKTFLARLLTDFLRLHGAPARAFDLAPDEEGLEPDARTLSDYLPQCTMRASIADVRGQMALFDSLIRDDGIGKVVDVDHTAFRRFFDVADQIGFLAEARRRSIEPVILFPASPQPACVKSYADLVFRLPTAMVIAVFNGAIVQGRKFREHYPFARAAAVPLQIPTLAPALKEQADSAGYSFVDFHEQRPTTLPIGDAFELRSWTKRVFLEFRELELRLLLEKLRTSLRQ
jgi:hypothetical protein